MEIRNLNPRYTLLSYDINLMKNTIKDIEPEELLSTCPQTKIPLNTLFYHFDNANYEINQTAQFEDTQYYFNFLGHQKDLSTCQVLYNTNELTLLDLSLVSIEFGFNPTMFYYYNKNKRLKNMTRFINDYCVEHQLDGYITYNIKDIGNEEYDSDSCVTYVNGMTALCPTVYLIQSELKILSNIQLKKSNQMMKKSELIKLHNIVFCNLYNIMSVILDDEIFDLTLESSFLFKSIVLYTNENHSLSYFLTSKPHLATLLQINATNLTDECEFDYYQDQLLMNEPEIDEHLKVDIITNRPIQSHHSDALFDKALTIISEKFNLTSFIYVHYHQLEKLPLLNQYTLDMMKNKNLNDIKNIITTIEKIIINQLYLNYKQSDKGRRANVNFINLEYIQTTYQYIKSHIMNLLMSSEKAFDIINGAIDKNIVNYFNVDYLYHDIVEMKYKNPKILHQDLLNDVASYKHIPMIDLKYLKIITKMSDDQASILNEIEDVQLNIYDVYKKFIAGTKSFKDLYDFLGIDYLYDYLKKFALNNQLNISMVWGYKNLSLLDQMENFNVNDLETDIEFFKSKLELMKTKILIVKFLKMLANILELSIDDTDTRLYLVHNIEKIINDNQEIKNLLQDVNTDWYAISQEYTNQQMQSLYNLFLLNNTNELLLSYIYQYLNIELSPVIKDEILKLIKSKQLLQIWVSFLNKEINKDTLSNIVFASYAELSKQQSSIREKERKQRDKIHSEEMEEKSKLKSKRQTEVIEEEQKEEQNEEQKEIERQERRRKRQEREAKEQAEQQEAEKAEEERTERRKKRQEEREAKEQSEKEEEERNERRRKRKEQEDKSLERIEKEQEQEKEQRKLEKEMAREEKRLEKESRKIARQEKLEAEREKKSTIEDEETQSM